MNLLDRGGNGWPASTTYEIRNATQFLFKTGALGTTASQDFNVPVIFCLPASDIDIYTIVLLLPEGNVNDALDVGLEIPQCRVYLSYYQTSATMALGTNGSMCNPCGVGDVAVSMYFADSPLLSHYGWNRDSFYSLSKVYGGDFASGNDTLQLMGTLLYGYVGWVEQCLSSGSYR
jgi:hypothetical protein